MYVHFRRLSWLLPFALLLALVLTVSPFFSPISQAATHSSPTQTTKSTDANSPVGKEIRINLAKQWLYVYDHGREVYNSPVTTGRPELATPIGTYHVFAKLSPTTFISPWPKGSPYWYAPTHINYALEWGVGGYFLHDSWWRTVYGPGTNTGYYDPVYGWQTGTHGCVTMPLATAAWLYKWAPIGTTVIIS